VLRDVVDEGDWSKVADLKVAIGLEEGYQTQGYAAFIRGRCDGWRKAIAAGEGAWFGAFDGETLAADLGIFTDGRIARFQSVETAAAYRRRGLCSALVVHALDWLQQRAPHARPVIVAEAEGDAGRLYRRIGFALVERQVSALLRPEGY
jgi:GNAT superfamily N-acetyltransferase